MTGSARPFVWVLLGPHKGDNNQVIALAEALGFPYRAIQLRYRWFAHLPAVCRSAAIFQLELDCRGQISAPWPALVLGIGQRSAPVARYVKQASQGAARIVRLGDPMVSHRLFDLVITTTQYAVRDGANVVRLPITITARQQALPTAKERDWLESFPAPRRLLVIGGRTSLWRLDPQVVTRSLTALNARAAREGGSVLAVTSPRTSPALIRAAKEAIGAAAVVTEDFPRYGALIAAADEVHVTGDSVSMLSDAVASGKPVGLVPLEPDWVGRLIQWAGSVRGRPFRIRDLQRFWSDLSRRGLVGTLDEPRRGTLESKPVETAVSAVRALLEEPAQFTERTAATTRAGVPRPAAL
jgi:mitochondrial fission protein ELM1